MEEEEGVLKVPRASTPLGKEVREGMRFPQERREEWRVWNLPLPQHPSQGRALQEGAHVEVVGVEEGVLKVSRASTPLVKEVREGWRLHLHEDPYLGREHPEGVHVEWVVEVEAKEVGEVVWGVDCQVSRKDTTRLMRIMITVPRG